MGSMCCLRTFILLRHLISNHSSMELDKTRTKVDVPSISSYQRVIADLHAHARKWVHIAKKFGYLSIWEILVTWPYRPPVRPHHRVTNVKSHTFYLLWEVATWNSTSMLWPIGSCQNRVCADQHHMTVARAQVSTHRVCEFFEVIRLQVAGFQLIAGSTPSGFLCNDCKCIVWSKLQIYQRVLRL